MNSVDPTRQRRLVGVAFWSLAGLSAVLLFSFLVAFAGWGLTPSALYQTCLSFLRMAPPICKAAAAALFLFGAAGLGAGAGQLLQQVVRTRLLLRGLRRRLTPPAEPVGSMAAELGLSARLDVVDDRDVYAFSFGFWRPRVLVSTGMLHLLDVDELKAVLLHEAHHVRNFDALKVALVRAMARALFFLPLAQDLARGYLILKELAADEYALQRMGDRWPLASAMHKLARLAKEPAAGAIAGAGGEAALRTRQLLDYPRAVDVPVVRSPTAALASIATVTVLIWLSLVMFDPMITSAAMGVCPVLY